PRDVPGDKDGVGLEALTHEDRGDIPTESGQDEPPLSSGGDPATADLKVREMDPGEERVHEARGRLPDRARHREGERSVAPPSACEGSTPRRLGRLRRTSPRTRRRGRKPHGEPGPPAPRAPCSAAAGSAEPEGGPSGAGASRRADHERAP